MSHTVKFMYYPEQEDVRRIIADIRWRVSHQGDHSGTDIVRFPTNEVFDNEDAAMAYIKQHDRGNYDGIAVKFRDFSTVQDTIQIKKLRYKISTTLTKKDEYIHTHSVKTRKPIYISCPCCGSKLNKDRLSSNICPLCRTDLRSPSVLQKIKAFDEKIKDYETAIKKEQLKRKGEAEIQWLVKYEYHC